MTREEAKDEDRNTVSGGGEPCRAARRRCVYAQSSGKVAAVIKGLDNPFFQYMRQGIDAKAKELGVEVNIQAASGMGDSTGQADRLSAVAMQDYGCSLVNPISVSNLVQALVPVAQKKAPIVNIDSVVDPAQAEAAGLREHVYRHRQRISRWAGGRGDAPAAARTAARSR